MNEFKTSAELKGNARAHLFGNYKTVIGAQVIMNLLFMTVSIVSYAATPEDGVAGQIIYWGIYVLATLVGGIFTSGSCYLYLNIACNRPARASYIFYGFKSGADKAILLKLYIMLIKLGTALPLIFFGALYYITNAGALIILIGIGGAIFVAGIVYVDLAFIPAFYLLHDFPDYTASHILKLSSKLMKGSIARGLYIYVSFIPMELLSLLSLGVGALWVEPYKNAVFAEFFLDLMRKKKIA